MNDYCHNLDDYLADDLATADAAAFRDHLPKCDECREAVAEQQWIDGLLQSPLQTQFEPIPQDVFAAVQISLSRREKQRSKILPAVLTVAAALVIAIGWTAIKWRANESAIREAAEENVANTEHTRSKDQPRASFVSSSNAIVVPVKSRHPDVSIVRIYPTYRPRREAQTAAIEPEAATNNNWNVYSNGG